MRKSIKVLLIVASSLVGIGILSLCISFALGGVDLMFKPSYDVEVKAMTATFDEVNIININDVSNNVKIIKSADNHVKVKYSISEDYNYYIKQIDDTLYIEYNELREWYNNIFRFNFNFYGYDLVVEVPEKTLAELNVKCTSGSIDADSINSLVTTLKTSSGSIDVGGNVGVLSATATSGSIDLNSDTVADSVTVKTTSGKLTVSGNVKGDVIVDNTSGGIEVSNLLCTKADLHTTSGRIKSENVKASDVKADSVSGRIAFDDVICTGDMNLAATSGSIELNSVDAANYDINTRSGSIKAEILSPKLYNVKSTSGSEKTPELDADATGVLSAKATSGSIKIELAD